MVLLAIYLGIYSYLIFFLGIVGWLYKPVISICTLFFTLIFSAFYYFRYFLKDSRFKMQDLRERIQKTFHNFSRLEIFLLILLSLQALVNLMGALGPELAFDALWYHLTLPKLFLQFHKIVYIPGGLFNYSVMPKLGEMYYVTSLALGNEIVAKIIHFIFGILMCIATFNISRKLFNQTISILIVVVFYSNLVVGWMSITAYTDLIRGFFEVTSLLAFLNWIETKRISLYIASAFLLGCAITAKVLAAGSLVMFLTMIIVYLHKQEKNMLSIAKHIIFFSIISLLIPLPWFIFAYIHTGNPLFPIFSKGFGVGFAHELLNPVFFITNLWALFTHAADPISPLYIAFTPLLIFIWIIRTSPLTFISSPQGRGNIGKILILYAIVSLVVWYVTPDTGGGRFIVPYLPVYSILIGSIFTYPFPSWFQKCLYSFIIIVVVVSISYRGIANKRYLPVIFGTESKREFLTNNLNFSFGDFYDTDGFFMTHIKPTDKVLLFGFHNEYYVDFPFIDNSYVRKGDRFNYIAVQHGRIPQRFYNWKEIYHNTKTDVSLYESPHAQWVSY